MVSDPDKGGTGYGRRKKKRKVSLRDLRTVLQRPETILQRALLRYLEPQR